jgi:lambda family phage tail tape measure protein
LGGNAMTSGLLGFHSVFAGIKRDLLDLSSIGEQVANSLNNSLGNAFGDFVTGAKQGKDAFRDFAISVMSDTSRLLGSKAMSGLLSFIPGMGGLSSGGMVGAVPSLLTGGEFVVGPQTAKRLGYDTLRRLNNYADGGLVYGGSGVKDDIPARLAPGSFIIKKGAAKRIGTDYLEALVNGGVQHRLLGGFLGMPALYGAL